ncbi:FAD-binding oxidoreductase [Salsuginibacillus kocurii]|uniref:FAD-binding oxidoreductase n=1 Tax=Salsuginibacillus kocurii TaxID=427078 RepID=UPI00037A5CCF|nr:FAD-linked oxidase C-terminal domain-containing protein [Salsuginibacillus kocurii]
MANEWITELRVLIDDGRLLTSPADCYSYSFDGSFGSYLPEAVVQAQSTEEVSNVLKLANQRNIPVYPRGQGTSMSGGPLPVKGGIVLDVSQWNERLDIYPEDMVAVVSPGVITSDIHEKANEHELMYPPDPSSSHVSTIAGNLAENSGGPRGLKYGVTKDYVIGLEVVTPEGNIIRTGGRTIKNVTGYDLTKLIIGSEGMLGVITEATLKLIPKPASVRTLMVTFDTLVEAGGAISELLTSNIFPSKMELMDQASLQAVEQYSAAGLPTDVEALILIELDGHPLALEEEIQQTVTLCRQLGARDISVPEKPEEAKKLWEARKQVSPAIVQWKPTKVAEDITVPRSKIPDMCERLIDIRKRYQLHLVVFGHAGDGNLHPNIICDKRDHEEMQRVEQAVEEIFQSAVQLGGTLSGEHGIGTMKSPFMEMELGQTGIDMMKRIKQAWDPKDILNPGKMFPEPGQKLVLRDD